MKYPNENASLDPEILFGQSRYSLLNLVYKYNNQTEFELFYRYLSVYLHQ